ncbi:hypothetical protein ACH4FX_12265 [Streptomyces sp. NPDC018019]|uniref:hypothetical protein n=1 Tax=Streptomyces sp. NPDC018019 TaxID=3365030 RepID=UPI0037A9FE80
MLLVLVAAIAVLAIVFGYPLLCYLSPLTACRRCDGWGHATKTGRDGQLRRGKDCRRCRTTGKRVRIGRRIYERAAEVHRLGSK